MNIFQIALLKSLEEQQAFCPASATMISDISSHYEPYLKVFEIPLAINKGFVESVKENNITYYFLSKKGIKFLDDLAQKAKPPASVAVDTDSNTGQSTETTNSKTEQMAAALREANEAITKLAAENIKLRASLDEKAVCEFKGYLLGGAGVNGLQLYSEDDRLVAFGTLDEAKENGVKSCLDSAYDFEVYGLVKVGAFRTRTVVDWVEV
jgi:hypothetical protein